MGCNVSDVASSYGHVESFATSSSPSTEVALPVTALATSDPPPLAADALAERRRLARLVLAMVVAGTMIGVVYHLILHYGLGWPYPWSTYLFRPAARFSDYLTDWITVRSYGAAEPVLPAQLSGYFYKVPDDYILAYSPVAHLVMRGIATLPSALGLALEIAAMVITAVFAAYLCMKEAFANTWARCVAAIAFAVAAYPVVFAADRGNLEMLVFVIVFWGVYLYAKGSLGWALTLFGLAAAMKYYPAILLLLPVIDRRYRYAIWGAAVTVLSTIVATMAIGFMTPGISPVGVAKYAYHTLTGVHGGYASWGFEGICYRHSIWGVVHMAWIRLFGADPSGRVVLLYMVAGMLAVAGVVAWLYVAAGPRGSRVALWRKAGVLIILMILVPPLSADYTSLYLFIPLCLMLTALRLPRAGKVAAIMLALCLVPMDYLVIEPWVKGSAYVSPTIGDTKSSTIAYAFFLTAALAMMLIHLRDDRLQRPDSPADPAVT